MTAKTKRPRFIVQFNLATLLLVTALCGSSMAYFLARTNRLQLTTKMNSLAALDSKLPVSDVATYRMNNRSARSDSLELWVPRHGRVRLCWSTQLFDDNFVAEGKPIPLGEGRHIIDLRVLKKEALIVVDDQVVLTRRYSPDWNVARPAELDFVGDQELTSKRTVILSAAGVATLTANETYDPEKHQFGLKVWLEK